MTREERTRRAVLQTAVVTGVTVFATPMFTGSVAADHDPDDGPVFDDGDTPSRDGEWNQRQNDRVYIYYQDGYEDDAELMDSYVTGARDAVNELIRGNEDSHIELYLMPFDQYDDDEFAGYESYSADEGLFEHYRLSMRPPIENPRYGSEDDVERDREYQNRVSEGYFRMILMRLVAIHRGAGNYRDVMPRWFTAGFPSYIAQYETEFGDPRLTERITEYAVDVQEEPDTFNTVRGSDSNTIVRRLLLNEYVMDEYGFEAMVHIAIGESSSFENAVETHFGVSMREFGDRFEAWLGTAYPVTDEPDTDGETEPDGPDIPDDWVDGEEPDGPETPGYSSGGRELEGDGDIPEGATPDDDGDGDGLLWWLLGAAGVTGGVSGAYLGFSRGDGEVEDVDGDGSGAVDVEDGAGESESGDQGE